MIKSLNKLGVSTFFVQKLFGYRKGAICAFVFPQKIQAIHDSTKFHKKIKQNQPQAHFAGWNSSL